MNDMKRGTYIIALDIGTTSTKGILYRISGEDRTGDEDHIDDEVSDSASLSYPSYFPCPGYAEQDPDDVLGAVVSVVSALTKNIHPQDVGALVFSGILHSMLPVDKNCRPLTHAHLWNDMRAKQQSNELSSGRLDSNEVYVRTGCPIHPMYYPARLLWFKQEAGGILKKTYKFISIKEYVLYHLYGKFIIDRSTASGTGVWSMNKLGWDRDLIADIGFNTGLFSEVAEPVDSTGGLNREIALKMGLQEGTPGILGATDGPLAHLGSIGFDDTGMSLTVGTSAALRKIEPKPTVNIETGMWCYYLLDGFWITGGVIQDAGNVFKWLSDTFFQKDSRTVFDYIETSARNVPPGSEGLFFFPFMAGERSPCYNPDARAAVIGMTFSHGREHILRSLMEGIAYRISTLYRILSEGNDYRLVLTGGILDSPTWMQVTADFLGRSLWKPGKRYAAAWGAVLLALRALEIVDSPEKLQQFVSASGRIDYNCRTHRQYKVIRASYETYYQRLFGT